VICWRWWSVVDASDGPRLSGPFAGGGAWPVDAPFESSGARRAHAGEAGVFAWAGPRPNLPREDWHPSGRVVLGRVRLSGRVRSIAGGQMIGDYGEVVSLDEVLRGSVSLEALARAYGVPVVRHRCVQARLCPGCGSRWS
jgi:hypothetical protein